MSSFEFMKENKRKFSDVRFARYRNKDFSVADDAVGSKVAIGSTTKGRELMDDKTKEPIQASCRETVGKQTGFQDYNELRNAFKLKKIKKNSGSFNNNNE